MIRDWQFWKGRRVLITGHTGFKGSWLSKVLLELGAQVTGYALLPPAEPSVFELLKLKDRINSITGDVRDLEHMLSVFSQVQPEIVLHMAAQPIVKESYENPVYTYDVNVMGTVNVLECVRCTASVKSFLNVTTDKVYRNREWEWGYRENEELNGQDPYSNSKSCSELVTESYVHSFFADRKLAVSTARAGNVVGGGDFAPDRIIPDCIRATREQKEIRLRNPQSIRPYQHVLEPLMVYLLILEQQYKNPELAGSYNVGPDEADCLTTEELTELFCREWKKQTGQEMHWSCQKVEEFHEANYLKLDCSKLKHAFGWKPVWNMETAMEKIVEWTVCWEKGADVDQCMVKQIMEYSGMKRI